MGETAPVMQSPPTRSLPQHMGITIQDEIWMGTQPNDIKEYIMIHADIKENYSALV